MSRGDYLTSTVELRDTAAARAVFSVKGGGQIMDLFSHLDESWLTVGSVQKFVRNMGVMVDRKTARKALNTLTEMGYLEKMVSSEKDNSPGIYRRRLSEAQRDLRRRNSVRALRMRSLREKQASRVDKIRSTEFIDQ